MAEDQTTESIPPRMTGHLSNLASMYDPNFLELVCEKGQILIRRLSSKITEKSFPCSVYFSQSSKARTHREGETTTANRSKDGVADSTFSDPLSGFSGLTKLARRDKSKLTSYPNCSLENSLQTGYLELLSEMYEDDFNVFMEHDKKCYDKQLKDSSIVPVNKFKSFKERYASKLVEEVPWHTVNRCSEVPQSSLKQYEASVKFMRSKEKKSMIDEKSDRVNFSIFLRPAALLKSNHPSYGATRPTVSPGLAGAENSEGNHRSASRSSNPFGQEGNFIVTNMEPILPDSEPQKRLPPDEQSEVFGSKDTPSNTRLPNKIHGISSSLAPNTCNKGKIGNRKPVEQMVASSICSRGASNCPTYSLKRRYEDVNLSENAMEEPESTTKAAASRGRKGAKRKRKEVHNLSERNRRDKINKKMRALQELIPNCNKVDKASMLDEAIEYLKTLQLQVKIMSMGSGIYMPPMMLPAAMQHINTQNLAAYSPMAAGMGTRLQMGLGCSPAQFPTSLVSGAAAPPGIMQARLNVLGFPGQMLLMSTSRSPFVSSAGRFSPPWVRAPGVCQPAALQVEQPGAAVSVSASKDLNPTHELQKK